MFLQFFPPISVCKARNKMRWTDLQPNLEESLEDHRPPNTSKRVRMVRYPGEFWNNLVTFQSLVAKNYGSSCRWSTGYRSQQHETHIRPQEESEGERMERVGASMPQLQNVWFSYWKWTLQADLTSWKYKVPWFHGTDSTFFGAPHFVTMRFITDFRVPRKNIPPANSWI